MKCNLYEWRGSIYSGAAALAEAANVHKKTVYAILERDGNLEMLGVKKGRRLGSPVHIGARSWPSQKALAEEIKVNVETLRNWIKKGQLHKIENLLGE